MIFASLGLCFLLILTLAVATFGEESNANNIYETQVIILDGNDEGRIFDGIGGLSAGAASRLLIDYPEPQRSQILDFLFKPNFGASLHDLKVEIGGTTNSTWGSEPSHANTREEFEHPKPEYYHRGYEWWLMKEARKRNPDIILEGLQWGAPGWIGDGIFFSQDNADYIVKFIQGARDYHGVNINYQGIRNETGYEIEWIKTLRKTLDNAGLQDVKVVAADDAGDVEWKIAKDIITDPELGKAVYAVGMHYVPYTSTDEAKNLGKPLWYSEAAMYGEPWGRAKNFARLYNRNYILGRMTKTLVCTSITSLYDSLVPFGVPIWNDPGLMKANTPWSGHYEVPPATWATAHTTQFVKLGWKYLDGGCGFLNTAGSYVSLRSPGADGNYSIIIETMNNVSYDEANQNSEALEEEPEVSACRVKFNLRYLSTGTVHVWRSTKSAQFEQLQDITPQNGSFEITLEGNSIYTLSTTEGQRKGSYEIPKEIPFPFPYNDDFDSYQLGKMPRYFSDQEGNFAIAERTDHKGKCLRQIVPQRGITWSGGVESPWTIIGDATWDNYETSVDIHFEGDGFAALYGRIDDALSNPMPGGYGLRFDHTGAWQLLDTNNALESGQVDTAFNSWHNLRLKFKGNQVIAEIDGIAICEIENNVHPKGAVALASSYSFVDFDNFVVRPFSN